MKRTKELAFRPERIVLSEPDRASAYLLEVFELGDRQCATWLYVDRLGLARWKCHACEAGSMYRRLDANMLSAAWGHVDGHAAPGAVPLGHFMAQWNHRVSGQRPEFEPEARRLLREIDG